MVLYNYLKMKDVKANQLPADTNPDRSTKVSISSFAAVFILFCTPLFNMPIREILMHHCLKAVTEK